MNIDIIYYPGDIVYYVKEYQVIKVIVESITVNVTKNNPQLVYNISQYGQEDNPKKKNIPINGAYLVKDFKKAKESALANWKVIKKEVTDQIVNMKDEMFDIKPKEEKNDS